MDRYSSNRFSGGTRPAGPSGRWALRRLVVIGATAAVLAAGIAPMSAAAAKGPRIGPVRIFASVPAPGHPFGIAVDDGRVYVSTSAGDFFADPANGGHRNSDGERVFTYDAGGTLLNTTSIATMPDATMGLWGIAVDGNAGPRHALYVADMNGRILRVPLGARAGPPEVFSQVPEDTGLAGDWMLSMWNDLVFDPAGNLYVPDDKPRIWRVGPDGHASIWFTDPRLAGFFGFAGGPIGARIDPSGRWLYFSITVSAEFPLEGVIYRIRLVDHPTADDLQLVHRFSLVPNADPPQPGAIAFAASGNLYVSLLGPNQVAILNPAGDEIGRISSPLFHSPWGLAFTGQSLLVANGDLEPGDNPAAWKIFKVSVGERGLPLNEPRLPAG
jgi:sugar lactone lactonase YvrE